MGSKKDEWRELAEKELKGKPLEGLTWNTLEGIEVQPLYTEEELGMSERTVTTSSGNTVVVPEKADFGTLSSGGLY